MVRVYQAAGAALALLWATAAQADLLIKNVTLYDGTGAPAKAGAFVLVKGDKIAQVSSSAIAAKGAKVIDGTGKYLMPGIMESHIHLPGGQTGNVNNPTERKLIIDKPTGLKYLHGYLYVGVTAVYDSGNNNDYIFAMRADEQAGRIQSPRIFAGGGVITVPNGYAAGPAALKVQNWEQAKAELDHRFTYKPDMIKMTLDRQGVMFQPTVPALSQEMFAKVVKYISDNGYRTTVHITAEQDAETTINAGITALAHPVWRSIANDNFIKLAAEKKIPIATTLAYFGNIARVADDPSFFDEPLFKEVVDADELDRGKTVDRKRYIDTGMSPFMKMLAPHAMKNVKRLHDAGAVLTLGTDRTLPPMVHQELELLAQSGISAFDCIKIATLNGAIYVGHEKDFGSVEVGKWADLLLLNADPAADVKNFRTIAAVIKGGKQIDRSKLDLPVNRKKG
ncbi:MAG: hypothetical protein EXR11_07750 [Rhodospirillaceae bacterium]|nr:hypothetical protein [Rhodospirillaceae bacterium]